MAECKRNNQFSLWDSLAEYADIQDELQDALTSMECLQYEFETALDDLKDELEQIQEHIDGCYSKLRRFKVAPDTTEEELPFSL